MRFALYIAPALLIAGCAIQQEEEIRMGRQAAPEFEEQFGGLLEDPEIQEYVNDIGQRLARHAGREDLPWRYRVVDSDEINAFALPGGYIYITRGLLFGLENEAQLAAILAHETAHVANRDSVHQIQRTQVIQGGAGLAGALSDSDIVGSVGGLVGNLALMKYSRDQEKNADLGGLEYLAREGYRTDAMLEAMQIIAELSGKGGPPEFLSTHPNPENREEYLAAMLDREYWGIISAEREGRDRFERIVLEKSRHYVSEDSAPGRRPKRR